VAAFRAHVEGGARFLLKPVWIGLLSMLFASAVAVYGFVEVFGVSLFCSGQPPRGANIDHALALAFFAGLAVPVAMAMIKLVSGRLSERLWPPLLASVLLLEAAALGLAIAFVALDSSTYVERGGCFAMLGPPEKPSTETVHFGYLYVLWAVPLALILIGAAGVFFEMLRGRQNASRTLEG
jgi:hypothetical protein